MKKVRKFAEGGMNDDLSEDEKFFGTEELAEAAERPTFKATDKFKVRDVDAKPKQKEAVKDVDTDKMSFGKAFNYFKDKPGKTFPWRGKKYTKEMASDKKPTATKTKRTEQTDPGYVPPSARKEATKETAKPKGKRDMSKFATMSFSEQMEYLRTKGRENMGAKTKMAKGGTPAKKMMAGGMTKKYNKGGMGTKSNCGASVKASGGSRNK